jgi:hypothetical protein
MSIRIRQNYRRAGPAVSWADQESNPKIVPIGTLNHETHNEPQGLGLLRVGYQGSALQDPVEAMVDIGDGGGRLGPIDVPFALVAEDPFVVHLQPVVATRTRSTIALVMAVTPVTGPSDRLYATRSIAAILNQVIALPQWVRGVSVLSAGTFQFRDRAGVPLSAVLTGAHDRPALAADVLVTAAGTIVLYY